MASSEQLRKIAIYCDSYSPQGNNDSSLKSDTNTTYDSCTRCSHFTNKGLCELDLIDKVLSSLSMENELKS